MMKLIIEKIMRKIAVTSLLLLSALFGYAQSADEQVANCLNTTDFFMLDEIYPTLKDDVETPMLKTFAESILYTVFNCPEKAVPTIDELIVNYQEEIGLENVKNMLIYQSWMLMSRGEYQDAYSRLDSFIEQLLPHVPADFVGDCIGVRRLCKALLDEERPQLIRPDSDCVVDIEIDTLRIEGNEDDVRHSTLMFIPVVVNGQKERFIFDTGCGGGLFLSQEYADRLGVRVIMDSLSISGSGGFSYGQMGIIDSIEVGNMRFKNVKVTIAPPNPEVDTLYRVDAVLGIDIMDYAGEVQIYPNRGKMVFPVDKTPLPHSGRNMLRMIGTDAFFLKSYSNSERLLMFFDTGDVYAHLNGKYYSEHSDYINLNGVKEHRISGGMGGAELSEFYTLPSFPFKIGDREFEIENMIVGANPKALGQQFGSGALGMAFINSFEKITISFDKMFVEVE